MMNYILVSTSLLAACAGLRPSRPDVARYRAEQDYSCKTVEVSETEAVGARSVFTAKGCDQTGTYVVHCMAGAGCDAYSEAEWAKKEARLTASDVTYNVVNECRDPVHLHAAGDDRKFRLAPGQNELIVGKVGDQLELTDDAGTVLHTIAIKEDDRSLRVSSACVTLAY